jgi:hypothetical protein
VLLRVHTIMALALRAGGLKFRLDLIGFSVPLPTGP